MSHPMVHDISANKNRHDEVPENKERNWRTCSFREIAFSLPPLFNFLDQRIPLLLWVMWSHVISYYLLQQVNISRDPKLQVESCCLLNPVYVLIDGDLNKRLSRECIA